MSRFSFECGSLPESSHVVSFRGDEGLSQLYRFEIALLIPDSDCAALELNDVVGSPATLTVQSRDDAPPAEQTPIHGIVSEIELVHSEGGKALFCVILVPAHFRLTESHHSRMFTAQTVPDIIQWVFDQADLGSQLQMRLSAEHPEEEHVCQYHETDFDFVSRWLEREGMYFFFDHSGEEEKLIITDHKATHEPSRDAAVRFRPVAGGDATASESLTEFRPVHRALPATVRIQDYDLTRPSLDVSAEAEVSSEGQGQVVIHEARCFSPEDAERLVAIRAEELLATGATFEASGTVFGLRAGYRFELEEHQQGDLNQEYLITRLHHEAAQSAESRELRELLGHDMTEGYAAFPTVIPASVQYRHPTATRWPRIRGFELGVIDGQADSDYAQLDEHGRYLVRFHFDESELEDGSTSTRIRMMQPHAGSLEGFHFPLRKGTEVAVAFLGGDPDRPVIAGAVPNALNPSVVTSDNHTQNVIQTGGRTRIELEDQDGQQHVYMYTPTEDTYLHIGEPFNPDRNVVLKTKKDCLFEIGTNQDINVGGVLEESVTKDVTETYSNTQTSTIDGPQETKVDGKVVELYFGKQDTTVTKGKRHEIFHNGQTTMTLGARQETYTGGQVTHGFGGTTEIYATKLTRSVTGATSEDHQGTLNEIVAGPVTEIYGSAEEKFGATTCTQAKLTWISPQTTLTAPNWTITNASRTEQKTNFDNVKWVITGADGTSTGRTIFKLEILGRGTGATGAKAELTDIAVGIQGPVLDAGLLHLEGGAVKINLCGNKTKS